MDQQLVLEAWTNEFPLLKAANFHVPDGPTNGYVRALNGLVEVLNRMGCGYSIEVLRIKVLLARGTGKIGPTP